jgi:glycosyltransferase involved in cell wall biosynthesis
MTETAIMTNEPLVSVCIPTFNGSLFLHETISSVLNQTYKNIQIVVSDHSSTDKTLEIINSFDDKRIEIYSFLQEGRAADNWNHSCSKARGKYIQLLCQDDVLYPECIQQHVTELEKAPENISFSFSNRDVISPQGRRVLRNRGWKIKENVISLQGAVDSLVSSGTNLFGEPCAVVMRSKSFQTTNGFRGKYLIDLNMWLDLWQLGPALKIDRSLCQFRISKSSWTSQLQQAQSLEFEAFAKELYKNFNEFTSDKSLGRGISRSRSMQRKRFWLTLIVESLKI